MENKVKKKGRWKSFFSGVLIGLFIIVIFIPHVDMLDKLKGIYYLALLVGIIISFILGIIIHEAGHLFFGLRSNYEFVSFRIFSHVWTKENGKIVHKKNKGTAAILGQCLMKPKFEYSEDFKFLAYNRGGYIFNLITALILYGLTFIPKINIFIFFTLFAMIFMQLILFISNFAAISDQLPNDGHNIKMAKKYPASKKAMYLQLFLASKLSEGYLYSDFIDMYEFDMEDVKEQPLIFSLASFKYSALIELGRIEEAIDLKRELYELRDYYPKAFKNGIIIEQAVNEYIFGDEEKFAQIIAQLPKPFKRLLKNPQKQDILAMLVTCNAAVNDLNYETMKNNFEVVIKTLPFESEKIIYSKFLQLIDEKYNSLKTNETLKEVEL